MPDAQYRPTALFQRAHDEPVPVLVSSELFLPKRSIAGWLRGVLRTTVPEATIREHSKAALWEHKIRLAENPGAPAPALDAVAAEQRYHRGLGGLVATAPDTGHDVRALRL